MRALTLIELLVVLAILGVLAAFTLGAVGRAKGKATNVKCASNLRQLTQAWLLYADEHQGRLPSVFYYHSNPLNVAQGNVNTNAWVRGSMVEIEQRNHLGTAPAPGAVSRALAGNSDVSPQS